MREMIRIANAGGYWGDDVAQFDRQVRIAPVDYVTLDFLAEITMSIMQKQRRRDPKAGYARDFVTQVELQLDLLGERGVRVVTNAGGINPLGCCEALRQMMERHGQILTTIAVAGDDIKDRLEQLVAAGVTLDNMDDGMPFSTVRDRVSSANAYFGAWPVVEALNTGAQIVVTGRCTDTGITLGPMIHEFGWKPDDWDRLASGIVAGHIIECGAHCTGGNFTDWQHIERLEAIGYPALEAFPDGSFIVTKHPGTGGAVSVRTVKEQLVYEMGDPRSYVTPDVIADFTTIQLEQDGIDRVRVWGVKGRPAPSTLKVSISHTDGWKANGTLIISGPKALEKARKFAEIVWSRLGITFLDQHTEFVGHSACWGDRALRTEPNEVLLRLSVRDQDRGKIERFSRMIPSVILSGPPGVAVTGGRPEVQEVVAYWPTLVPRDMVKARLVADGVDGELEWPTPVVPDAVSDESPAAPEQPASGISNPVRVRLGDLAHARSGDKGDTANIGVIARSPEIYPLLVASLTAEEIQRHFQRICRGKVVRYEVPNLWALNFLLHESLGGGGTVSLRLDAQGKTLAHMLLEMDIWIPGEARGIVSVAYSADRAEDELYRSTVQT